MNEMGPCTPLLHEFIASYTGETGEQRGLDDALPQLPWEARNWVTSENPLPWPAGRRPSPRAFFSSFAGNQASYGEWIDSVSLQIVNTSTCVRL